MMLRYPKRLIEVDLPIRRISAHARREKSIRHGHISTLHIWWARRPLAACRAVICAALWPDPVDLTEWASRGEEISAGAVAIRPGRFLDEARKQMIHWAQHCGHKSSAESHARFVAVQKNPKLLDDPAELRKVLLDFIADFANWDNSTDKDYLDTARALTQAAHEALGGSPGTRPLVVDPFAGGGAIPLEALRVGADAFASDLNPVAVLLNKVVLEYIPKYGQKLADEVRKWGQWIKDQAEKELGEFYPKDPDGAMPIAYLWARTIKCEGPGCGATIPLVRHPWLRKSSDTPTAVTFKDNGPRHAVSPEIVSGRATAKATGTCSGFKVNCPRPACQFTTPKKRVQDQLSRLHGGADDAMLLAILSDGPHGRRYRAATKGDTDAVWRARQALARRATTATVPTEAIPTKDAHRAVGSQLPLYGFRVWGDLFSSRQKLSLSVLQTTARRAFSELAKTHEDQFARAMVCLLAFAVDKQVDYLSSLCRWVAGGEFIAATLGGEKKFPMLSDFAEANPVGPGSGSWSNQIDWIARFIERESAALSHGGNVARESATQQLLPGDVAAALITDPPYYDSVPYSDLSDFFYVWIRRTLAGIEDVADAPLTPKDREITVNHPGNAEETARYESLLTEAFAVGRETTSPAGVGVIVFAHKSTSGWEALVEAIIKSGWIVTASWPVDTERATRLNAIGTASLTSSVHLICRPRENPDGSVRTTEVGDWREVLAALPKRIHEWLPRLADEGIVGADAIFACLGPALEVFSRYSRVEKASGEQVLLREYLEQVWATVSKEALSMLFKEADASGLEPDARLTAIWLWTLGTAKMGDSRDARRIVGIDELSNKYAGGVPEESSEDEEDEDAKAKPRSGYYVEYDAARKIAQGLGAHLEKLTGVVEVKGEVARLLPVAERTKALFGKDQADAPTARRKKKDTQLKLDFAAELDAAEEQSGGWGDKSVSRPGETVLDRLHQAMILFAAGRSEALRRFLVEDGIGREARFWKLAQALSALYPPNTDEKRWVDGVLARKKGLGL